MPSPSCFLRRQRTVSVLSFVAALGQCSARPSPTVAFVASPASTTPHASLERPSSVAALLMYADDDKHALGPASGGLSGRRRADPPTQRYLDELGHPIEEKKIDYAGAGTLGDIMSSEESRDKDASIVSDGDARVSATIDEGLVTTAGGTLRSRFGSKVPNLTPLERIVLTANGNLQRIFSSYYDAPVHVHVDRCEMRAASSNCSVSVVANGKPLLDGASRPAVWDRKVHLSVHSRRFCTATSVVTVHSPECVRLVHSGEVGIGQLFRHLDKLPTFALLDAGRTDEGGLWRSYTLRCDELTCVIKEELVRDAWEIFPLP